ncbi:hypothetical protein [Erysipelothrix anatis]|uniref:hypothetical protein n=1 Tax=Erysipelothrix anatis TaxID=2683713 RepID=UPI001358AD09|nr:hypothetical protein [Erysipelothrix anatis]
MSLYRKISLGFWDDSQIVDEFTPEDKYFMLYLLTNPHTNLIGCYEISFRQMSNETGYSRDTIERLLDRMANLHSVIEYDKETKEVFIKNWHKYNWTRSPKFLKKIVELYGFVKSDDFKNKIYPIIEKTGADMVSIPYPYPMDTSVTASVTVTDTVTASVTTAEPIKKEEKEPRKSKSNKRGILKRFGEYEHVKLSEKEYLKLAEEFIDIDERIRNLDEYMEMSGKSYTNCNLVIRKWAKNDSKSSGKGNSPEKHAISQPTYNSEIELNEIDSSESEKAIEEFLKGTKDLRSEEETY